MIIACPACATRYVVPDSAIGADGRNVRCAKCRHNWFQDGPPLPPRETVAEAVAAEAPPSPPRQVPPSAPEEAPAPPAPDLVERSLQQPPPEPPPAEAAAPEPPAPPPEPAAPQPSAWDEPLAEVPGLRTEPAYTPGGRYGEPRSSFDYEPPFRPRRNKLKMWTWAAACFAGISLAAIGAVAAYGLPDWMPMARPTFAEAQPDLVLEFPPNRQDRRTLPNGTEFFGASGTVTNVGKASRTVPSILIVLRDARERIVYSWIVAPPKRQLAPGESVSINEAVTDVPKSAASAEIGWKPG